MRLPNGILKMVHQFSYDPDASFAEKVASMEQQLRDLRRKGYDGVVTNVEVANGYLKNEENWRLMEARARLCEELGLRLWIYDEHGYPSGAAGTMTLDSDPSMEALALAAVHKVLAPGQTAEISIPHGHLEAMGAFGYYFDGETVTGQDLAQKAIRVPFENGTFRFANNTDQKLFCLCFFTKPAFEGTHCQHNAFSIRRYIDIGHPNAGKAFVENTYAPYYERLAPYFRSGTIEAFFADESSYMGVYFNLKKKPREVQHPADPAVPLYAMVNWSSDLVRAFRETHGYCLTEELPWLFLGDSKHAQTVRQDYYTTLTALAQKNFFQPLADYCAAHGTRSSGHILLEERITDHPLFQGSFFPLLKTMHVPGMDMLDSRPERIWKKAFTALLVSSISRLHRDGVVMDEVSAHFQNKFSVKVEPQHIYTSLVLQHIFGATLFTSYYHDDNDAILHTVPGGRTVLQAVQEVLKLTQQPETPAVALHYPIEAVMANTVSPVDIATVYDSILNEFVIPYPIDRADLDKDLTLTPLVESDARDRAKAVEQTMECCMFRLMDRQVPFLFVDTESLRSHTPEQLVVYGNSLTDQLRELLPELQAKGCTVYCVGSCDAPLPAGVIPVADAAELPFRSGSAGTPGVAALWNKGCVLLSNSENCEKKLVLDGVVTDATELYSQNSLCVTAENGSSSFVIPPYGVVLAKFQA